MEFYSYKAMDYDDVYASASSAEPVYAAKRIMRSENGGGNNNGNNSCGEKGCFMGSTEPFGKGKNIDSLPLSMAYVPMQKFCEPESSKQGFQNGTFFSELYMPYNDEVCKR